LSFTADELWGYLPPAPGETTRGGNVLFATWYEGLRPLPADAPLSAADFDRLLDLRDDVARVLEPMRAAGEIGAALEAEITLRADAAARAWLAPFVDELRFLLISGDVTVEEAPEGKGIAASAAPTGKAKCVRCWQHRGDVGSHAEHPQLCGRCVSNVEGPGETRRWF
ncbi:MAG TPA: zinc finger domain-containing protein, partial [Luteimonas sp.]|nr:zinc finger domain-containing protein [Luteimonas sp.]